MQQLIGNDGSFANVPRISANLTDRASILSIIPKGFEDILQAHVKSDGIHLTLLNDEYKDNVIIIPDTLYNPTGNKVEYPRFLIERTIAQKAKVDYFTPYSEGGERYIFNQNEMMYIALQHRLCQLAGQSRAYSSLLRRDISKVCSFVQHVPSIAYNSIQKNNNAYIVMNLFDVETGSFKTLRNGKRDLTLGDQIHYKAYLPDIDGWLALKDQLPIQCSSDSGAGEVGKLILKPFAEGSLYRSVGHDIHFNKELNIWVMSSIFKSAQNITARNKTHVTANAYEIYGFEANSVFAQDWVYNKEKYPDLKNPTIEGYEPKDRCYKRMLAVIRPMDGETTQYLYGEAEVSKDFYDTCVWSEEKIVETFEDIVLPTDGTVVYAEETVSPEGFVTKHKKILVGYAEDGATPRPIYVEDAEAVQYIQHRLTGGPLGKSRLKVRVARKAGNARCDSNTGFKAVTKGKPYLGKIVLKDGTTVYPDLAFGMNSFKAKVNGTALARAALATERGFYKPKHWSNLLNTMDQKEIQDASDSLGSFDYYDEFGNLQKNVQVGVVYIRFTEIGDVFKSYRKQALSHETGRNLFHNQDPALYHYLWENYIDKDMSDALIEFQKVLCPDGQFEGDEDLPKYTVTDIQKGNLFSIDKDSITSTLVNFRADLAVLNENFNSKGFFLDFRPQLGPLIRIPSAKALKMFENELETGEWMYHSVFTSISKLIRNVLFKVPGYNFNKSNVPANKRRDTPSDRYLRDIKGIIFTSDESSEMNVTALSRPEVPGFAMKQVVDWNLPENTALITCQDTYIKALKNCYGEDWELHHLMYGFHGFHVRNPSLWRSQICKVKIWGPEDFRAYLMCTKGISLEKYLLLEENKDIVIFSPDVLGNSHSDSDKIA